MQLSKKFAQVALKLLTELQLLATPVGLPCLQVIYAASIGRIKLGKNSSIKMINLMRFLF